MSKYDRDSRDVYAVKRLGDEIGFGHLMSIAHEVWARELEEKGLPREGAFCSVGHSMVKDEYVEDAVTDPIYKVVVERALADTTQAEILVKTPRKSRESHEKDTPQTDCAWMKGE